MICKGWGEGERREGRAWEGREGPEGVGEKGVLLAHESFFIFALRVVKGFVFFGLSFFTKVFWSRGFFAFCTKVFSSGGFLLFGSPVSR